MECKFCGAELTEGSTVCPACGKDNEEKKKPIAKIIVAVVAALALLAVLAIVIVSGSGNGLGGNNTAQGTVPKNGNPDDVTCKGTYTVSDKKVKKGRGDVVASIGDQELTNGLLQIYYWSEIYSNYEEYVSEGGLDLAAPLDTQMANDELTWQQLCLENALTAWHVNQSMAMKAKEAGMELDATYAQQLSSLEQTMEDQAASSGFADADEMIAASMGQGSTLADYAEYVELMFYASAYYEALCAEIEITDAQIEDFYTQYKDVYEENGLTEDTRWIDVRHILIVPEGGTTEGSTTTYTDDEWEACRAAAQEILDGWAAGDATEESFAALANEHSEDGGSNTKGGLYQQVAEGEMVETFNDWCFDKTHKVGDTGLVKSPYGYHIMYFSGETVAWKYVAEQNLMTTMQNTLVDTVLTNNPMTVDYSKILLGYVQLVSES